MRKFFISFEFEFEITGGGQINSAIDPVSEEQNLKEKS
jgi:hypothetical protein